MPQNPLYEISLVAAFAAGVVALFAPCCISYLLPAYFGNVFKEKKRILFMTLIYSLGIFVVMVPVVLGAKAISTLFFRLHDQTYYVGGFFMLVVAAMALVGIKLPMPQVTLRGSGKTDVVSTFILGMFSGVTSACCAPVLFGVIALSTLSPSTVEALGVGLSYVFGMVAPLYLASAFIEKKNVLEKPFLKRQLGIIRVGKREYPVFVSNIVAAAIFSVTGTLIIILAASGMLGMPTAESAIVQTIQNTATRVSEITRGVPGINFAFVLFGGFSLYLLARNLKE